MQEKTEKVGLITSTINMQITVHRVYHFDLYSVTNKNVTIFSFMLDNLNSRLLQMQTERAQCKQNKKNTSS